MTETYDAAPLPPPAPRLERSDDALVDDLAQQISTRVMSGDYAIGSWLRQETLAAEFGVSRTPIREALRQLQASGIVTLVPNRGALVHGPTPRDIREAYHVRAELEGFAAELSATLISDEQLDRLREAEELFRRAVKDFVAARGRKQGRSLAQAEWPRANDLFHEVIQNATNNRILVQTIAELHRRFPRNLTWTALAQDSRLLQANAEEHKRVLRAIEQSDPVRARQAMTEHVRRSGELVALRFAQRAVQSDEHG